MATAAEIQTAYKAIYRADLNVTVATAIANTGISLDAYIAQQLPQVASTTQAAVAIASFVTGTAPTSDKLDALKVEADKQVASYTALGVGNPQLGAYEAFGRSFATDASTTAGFNTKYGALSTADFIGVVYAQVYGTQPSAAAAANLTAQINYFTNLYTTNGVANAALAAKGAVLGQIVGYAFTSAASANSNLDNQVQSLLSSAAKGDTTVYNKALPVAVDPGQAGVSITLTTGAETVSTTAADPALRSTANNDTIGGEIKAGANIDGGAGSDTLATSYDGDVEVASIKGVEILALNNITNAGTFSLKNATGYTDVGFTNSAKLGTISEIALGTNLTVTDTTPASATLGAIFKFKADATTGASDAATLTVSGVNGTPTITVGDNDIELLTVKVNGVSDFKLGTDTALKTLTLTGDKSLTLNADLANNTAVKTIDASGLSAPLVLNAAGSTQKLTVTGGTGSDTISLNGALAHTIKGNGGNDTFNVDVSAANKTTLDATPTLAELTTTQGLVTITDFNAGDTLRLDVAEAAADRALVALNSTQLDQAAAKANILDAALFVESQVASATQDIVTTFKFGGDTYVLLDAKNTAGLGDADALIKLTGSVDFTLTGAGQNIFLI